MMTGKIQVSFNSYYKAKWGQRDTPYILFYSLPILTFSKVTNQEYFSVHIGWLFWNITINFLKNDTKRRIPRK